MRIPPLESMKTDERIRISDVPYLFFKDPDNTPNIKQLAKACLVCPTKLKTRFKNIYGIGVLQYYNEMRLNLAREMLLSGRFGTVQEIGNALGYLSMSQFANIFKKRFGILPSCFLIKDFGD